MDQQIISSLSLCHPIGEVVTYWLTGATEAAIQRTPVSLDDLPPPLFCRPRKSPKTESRQPSLIAGSCFGIPNLIPGRRHSQIPKNDVESTYSLQGSINHPSGGSPRALHRLPSKLDRTPLYLNHGSRTTLTESGSDHHPQHNQDQMEMGTLVRKKHSVSMDGSDEDGEEDHTRQLLVNEQQLHQLSGILVPKKMNVTIMPPVGSSPPMQEDFNTFKTFNEKRASFDPSNLLMLRESRSLDRFPSSDQRKKRLSFKRLTSKLTFSTKGSAPRVDSISENAVPPNIVVIGGGNKREPINGGLVGQQQPRQPEETSDYVPAPKSSDSYSFIDNSILRFSGDGLLLPPTPMQVRKPVAVQRRPTTATTGNGSEHTVSSCNGIVEGGDAADMPLMMMSDASTTTMARRPAIISTGPRVGGPQRERRNDSLCLSRNSETEPEDEDRFDKKWRSMDTLKDKRRGGAAVGGPCGGGVMDRERKKKVYERDYYFDGSGQDSASDDNRSAGEENSRRINFVDDFTSAEESSDAGNNRDTDSVSPKGKWYKNIFNNNNSSNNGNGNPVSSGSHHHHHRAPIGVNHNTKPDNLLLNNNNNNNSNRNKNHKRLNLGGSGGGGAKLVGLNALEAIKQSPEAKEEGDETDQEIMFSGEEKSGAGQRNSSVGSGYGQQQKEEPAVGSDEMPIVVVDSPQPLVGTGTDVVLGKIKLSAAPFVETSAKSLECGEHVA